MSLLQHIPKPSPPPQPPQPEFDPQVVSTAVAVVTALQVLGFTPPAVVYERQRQLQNQRKIFALAFVAVVLVYFVLSAVLWYGQVVLPVFGLANPLWNGVFLGDWPESWQSVLPVINPNPCGEGAVALNLAKWDQSDPDPDHVGPIIPEKVTPPVTFYIPDWERWRAIMQIPENIEGYTKAFAQHPQLPAGFWWQNEIKLGIQASLRDSSWPCFVIRGTQDVALLGTAPAEEESKGSLVVPPGGGIYKPPVIPQPGPAATPSTAPEPTQSQNLTPTPIYIEGETQFSNEQSAAQAQCDGTSNSVLCMDLYSRNYADMGPESALNQAVAAVSGQSCHLELSELPWEGIEWLDGDWELVAKQASQLHVWRLDNSDPSVLAAVGPVASDGRTTVCIQMISGVPSEFPGMWSDWHTRSDHVIGDTSRFTLFGENRGDTNNDNQDEWEMVGGVISLSGPIFPDYPYTSKTELYPNNSLIVVYEYNFGKVWFYPFPGDVWPIETPEPSPTPGGIPEHIALETPAPTPSGFVTLAGLRDAVAQMGGDPNDFMLQGICSGEPPAQLEVAASAFFKLTLDLTSFPNAGCSYFDTAFEVGTFKAYDGGTWIQDAATGLWYTVKP